jgi:seryl-tRNA synthetase
MLDPRLIREQPETVAEALRKRGETTSIEGVRELDRKRRELLQQVESLKKERKDRSKKIGAILKEGGDAGPLREEVRLTGDRITALDEELGEVGRGLRRCMLELPNIPHESVPEGTSEADNPVVRTWGEPPEFSFEPRPHWDLGVELGIIDFERGAKIAGARFAVLFGAGARLERALAEFMLDLHTRVHGYTEVATPYLVNDRALLGTGNLPKFEEDLFKVEPGEYYLIPTAEVPVTNLHADEILEGARLPLAYCAHTPCFRSEAGSYGKDVRGLIRQHQFNKVEMVRFTAPESSFDELERLTGHAEEVLRRLGLHYRVVSLCTGDIGFSSAKTYDLEVWLPSQRLFREISSCSNFTDFQARRARIRYRPGPGEKPRLVHTLNGSGLAIGRTALAIMECYQQEDGGIVVPEVLRPYMGGLERIAPPGV